MTSRQRLIIASKHEMPDRVPVAPFSLGQLGTELPYRKGAFPKNPLAKELIEKTDILIPVHGVRFEHEILAGKAEVEQKTDGDVTTFRMSTPQGDLVWKKQKTVETSVMIEFPFKTPEDFERFCSIPYELPQIHLEDYQYWRETLGEEGLVLMQVGDALCFPAGWFAPEVFCMLCADRPQLIGRMVEMAAERVNHYAEALCKGGVDFFQVIGGEYATVQLGPRGFEKWVKPFDKTLIGKIHAHGARVFYHNHGRVMRYLDDFMEMGVDVLEPVEAPPGGDMDFKAAMKKTRGRMTLSGNLDDMEVLGRLEEEEIKSLARAILSQTGGNGHILGGTTSAMFEEKTARNFIALAEMVREIEG
ncbi:MAG: uroporphyrinogen decarboxylase family protein [Verrucomicrobiae bacterium]|nr:uroporphyrinogen decarboxylase family protein [Verrucomicrobiae bacterium]